LNSNLIIIYWSNNYEYRWSLSETKQIQQKISPLIDANLKWVGAHISLSSDSKYT